MANTCCWYETRLPENLIKDILDNLNKIDESVFIDSEVDIYNPVSYTHLRAHET